MLKIALIAPSFFSYDKAIAKMIECFGHEVVIFDDRPSNTNLSKILIRLKLHFFLRRKIKNHKEKIIEKIQKEKVDCLFVISPEVFDVAMVDEIKKNNPNIKIILYLWDSILNKSNTKSLVNSLDTVYSFDRRDCEIYPRLKFHPLFFEDLFYTFLGESEKKYKIAFIGSYHSNRFNLVELKQKLSRFFLHLYVQGDIVRVFRSLTLILNPRTFYYFWKNTTLKKLNKEEVANIFKASKVIIDYQHPDQCGLTCRTFEALASGCQLMTTNSDIVNYDFFDNELIYVMKDEKDISLSFVDKEVSREKLLLMKESISRYSLQSWVAEVLISNLS